MTQHTLPDSVQPTAQTPVFAADELPPALLTEHALGIGHWGRLHLLEGSIWFVDLMTNAEEHLTAPQTWTIPPQRPHKLRLHGPVQLRIEFFVEPRQSA